MAYERINWQNGEVGNTPLNANNLNRMDMTLEEHDQKIGDHDYEIENLKTGAQGITEELNKKMDRINPQGSGTFSIPAVNTDNINAQTVEADEIKVAKVGSKSGTAPVVFDNDILVSGITTPIGSLASSASAKAESAERMAYEADRTAGTAKTTASTAYSRVQENIFRTDKLEGIVGGGVGESIPQYTYYNGKYLRPDGEIANYNDSARVIEFEINKNSDSGCNVIFKNVDLIPTDASILCGFYNAAGILLGEEMRGLIIMGDFDEDTGKMTRQYISYCVVPAPYYAKYVRISGIANGVVDIAIQNTLSDAVAELQSRSSSFLVLTNPSPLPACDSKNILGIHAKGNSTQNGTPTPTNPIPIVDASGEVTAHTINLCNVDDIVLGKSWNDTANASRGYVEITDVVVGETYTLSAENINGLSSISAMPMSGTELVGSAKTVDANTSSVSFAIANTVDKIRILFVAPSGTLTKAMAEGTKTMFCKGTSKSYVPYQSNSVSLPFEPKSVGSVANELIVNEDGSAKFVQRVFEYRLPSSNAWTLMETKTNTLRFVIANVLSAVNTECMCEYFKPTTQVGMGKIDEPSICVRDDLKGIAVMIDKATVSTKEQFLAWLNSNEVMLHYCTTPIETPLTPEEVASIRQLQTYKGTTVIESEMQIESVTYSGDIKAYIDYRINQIINPTALNEVAPMNLDETEE